MNLEVWPANPSLSWRLVTDAVMGGASSGVLHEVVSKGRTAICMGGTVSIANNGGFIQLALDLAPEANSFDANRFIGIELDLLGNGEVYGVHLRSTELTRPQQSYRYSFRAPEEWMTLRLPFEHFRPHRTEIKLRPTRLSRIGLVAIGREFTAMLAIARLAFY